MRISDWSSDVCSSDLLGVDDFKGLDLKGKIAVLFDGAPERFDNDRRAFHSSWREKLREVIARGAIGAVFVNTARDEEIGRASCRERVGQYVSNSVVAVYIIQNSSEI